MNDVRHTRAGETDALATWYVDLSNRETQAKQALAPFEVIAPSSDPEDLVDGLAVAIVRAEHARLLENLENVGRERERWQVAAQALYKHHAHVAHQRLARYDLFEALSERSEVDDIIESRRLRGRTR